MWDLPGPGLEPVSPTLAGGFLTTAPPGKLPFKFYEYILHIWTSQLKWLLVIPRSAGLSERKQLTWLTFHSFPFFPNFMMYASEIFLEFQVYFFCFPKLCHCMTAAAFMYSWSCWNGTFLHACPEKGLLQCPWSSWSTDFHTKFLSIHFSSQF